MAGKTISESAVCKTALVSAILTPASMGIWCNGSPLACHVRSTGSIPVILAMKENMKEIETNYASVNKKEFIEMLSKYPDDCEIRIGRSNGNGGIIVAAWKDGDVNMVITAHGGSLLGKQ